jgi:hypothetical protein
MKTPRLSLHIAALVVLACAAPSCAERDELLGATSSAVSPPPQYPPKVSANGRTMTDQTGAPWMMVADSPWGLMTQSSVADASTYFAARQAQGYNAVLISVLNTAGTPNEDGCTYDDICPFLVGHSESTFDISQPNPAYATRMLDMVSAAAAYSIVVLMETGQPFDIFRDNGGTKTQGYGAYMGGLFKTAPNVIWLLGNDFNYTVNSDNAIMNDLALGIKGADSKHLLTMEILGGPFPEGDCSTDDSLIAPLIDINGAYTYRPEYVLVPRCYDTTPVKPTFLVESNYESGDICSHDINGGPPGDDGTPQNLRRQTYWTLTSGGIGGYVNGNDLWITSIPPGWLNHLQTPGEIQVGYLASFIKGLDWYNLVPDLSHAFLTSGYGSYDPIDNCADTFTSTYATAALSSDAAVVYVPVTETVTVNLSKLSGGVTAQWFDPSNNTYRLIGSFPNSGSASFPPPGDNSGGDPDWVLLFTPSSGGGHGPAFVQVANNTQGSGEFSSLSATFNRAEVAGDLNIVAIGWNDTTAAVSSVTDSDGNAYHLALVTTGTGLRQAVYYASNVKGGSDTVTVSFGSTKANVPDLRILEYSGVSTLDVTSGAFGTSKGGTVSSGSATTTSSTDLVFGAGMTGWAFTGAGPGFTSEIITSDGDIAEGEATTVAGSYSATAAIANVSQNWVMQMVAFK